MNAFQNLLQINVAETVVGIFAILAAFKYVTELIDGILNRFGITTKKKIKNTATEKRIQTLERHDKWQYEEISKIANGIDEIKLSLQQKEMTDKAKTVATLRTQLYELHSKFTSQNYIDKSGLTAFMELGKIYEEAGGDDIYHDKLYPEIMTLEIK